MISLQLHNLTKSFPTADGAAIPALKNASVVIEPSEFVVVIGHNGSGKTTLLNLLAGEFQPDSGTISANIDGRDMDWAALPAPQRGQYVARVQQAPERGTVSDLTVLENLRLCQLPGAPSPFQSGLSAAARTALMDMLAGSVLQEKADALAGNLSQGQRQLLALEMALLRAPQLLLLDEHTASLDRRNATLCMARAEQASRRDRITVLMVTHDLGLAARYGDRLLILSDGHVTQNLAGESKNRLELGDIADLCGFWTRDVEDRLSSTERNDQPQNN